MLDIEKRMVDRVMIVSLFGRIDSTNADELTANLCADPTHNVRGVMINLATLNYVTSAGFRSLILAKNNAASRDCTFVLVDVSKKISELLAMTGLLTFFDVCPTEEDAMALITASAERGVPT